MDVARYLRRAYPLLPERLLREAIRNRDIRVNGAKYQAGQTIQGGDEILLYIPDARFDASLEFAFDDGRLLAPIKPQGLPVDADQDGIGQDTLLTRLRSKYPSAQLCNRLDAATGGLVIAAADEATYRSALAAFVEKSVDKTYVALAKGGFSQTEGDLRAYLAKDAASSKVRILQRGGPGAKPIETRYRVLWDDGAMAVLALFPITGRTHQLRAHMADFGHPLLGDDKYGDRVFNREHPGGLRLWCTEIRFASNGTMSAYHDARIFSPMPAWFPKFLTEDNKQ